MKKENRNVSETLPDNVMQADSSLRKKAEERLKKKQSVKATLLAAQNEQPALNHRCIEPVEMWKGSEADTLELLYELEVHQIELEMQNEELHLALDKTATATALYDFAPAGYFTIGYDGIICQLNLSGASMLGKGRSVLVDRKFDLFITADTRLVFHDFFRKIFETNSKQTCEVRLIVNGNPSIYVHLDGIISEDEKECLITAVDITERKQTGETIKISETNLISLINNRDESIWSIDNKYNYIIFNISVSNLFYKVKNFFKL